MGIHHVTCITVDGRRNIAFYRDVLGLRVVKRTVNFDDPTSWHLYFGDDVASPGTLITFFVWPDVPQQRLGPGMASALALSIPHGSKRYWQERTGAHEKHLPSGERSLALKDPDGLQVLLVEDDAEGKAWKGSPVPAEHQVRTIYGVRLTLDGLARTAEVLKELGYEQDHELRFSPLRGTGKVLIEEAPSRMPAVMGRGSTHHVAFQARDEQEQLSMRESLLSLGLSPTPVIERKYFRSVYCREPGGVLFEVATDGPGFFVDEDELGSSLVLPPWYEQRRAEIEAALPPLEGGE